MSEWRHRGSEFFSFKPKQITIDFWDFSGDPSYHTIYSCFKCSTSLHLVTCNSQRFKKTHLLARLADIQATSVERIPVILVFTYFDRFSSREQKDIFRREIVDWIHSWQRYVHKGHSHLISQSVKNPQKGGPAGSNEPQSSKDVSESQGSSAEDLPLLPLIHRVFFVNALTGDGVSGLRKCLVKIASGSISQDLEGFSGFQMVGKEIPTTYHQVELIIRQLRERFRTPRREGEQRPFYTMSELVYKKLKRPLSENGIEERDFAAALDFFHEVWLPYKVYV